LKNQIRRMIATYDKLLVMIFTLLSGVALKNSDF